MTTVGYGGGRVNVSSSTKYYRMLPSAGRPGRTQCEVQELRGDVFPNQGEVQESAMDIFPNAFSYAW